MRREIILVCLEEQSYTIYTVNSYDICISRMDLQIRNLLKLSSQATTFGAEIKDFLRRRQTCDTVQHPQGLEPQNQMDMSVQI